MPRIRPFFASLGRRATWTKAWRASWRFLRLRYPLIYITLGFAIYAYAWWYLTGFLPPIANDLVEVLAHAIRLFFDDADTLRLDLSDEQISRLSDIIRNLGYALAAILGALAILATIPFQIIKIWVNERTAHTAEQNLITKRLTDAVQMLGAEKTVKQVRDIPRLDQFKPGRWIPALGPDRSPLTDRETVEITEPNLEVRLGALYALERISKDSDADHLTVLDIICAYIRENSQAKPALAPPRADIAAALEILKRRTPAQRALEAEADRRPDLRQVDFRRNQLQRVDLQKADLRRAEMEGANLSWAEMEGANLVGAKMEGADLRGAKMEGADLVGAKMKGANLRRAKMEGAYLFGASLNSTSLTQAKLAEAAVSEVELSEEDQIRHEQIVEMFGDGSVRLIRDGAQILPGSPDWPAHWPPVELDYKQFHGAWRWWRESRGLPWPPPGKALADLAAYPAFPKSEWPSAPSDPSTSP